MDYFTSEAGEFKQIIFINSIPILHLKYYTTNIKKNLRSRSVKSITLIKSDCTDIIPFLHINIGKSIGIRLNQMARYITILFTPLKEQIIGLL